MIWWLGFVVRNEKSFKIFCISTQLDLYIVYFFFIVFFRIFLLDVSRILEGKILQWATRDIVYIKRRFCSYPGSRVGYRPIIRMTTFSCFWDLAKIYITILPQLCFRINYVCQVFLSIKCNISLGYNKLKEDGKWSKQIIKHSKICFSFMWIISPDLLFIIWRRKKLISYNF